MTNEDQLHVAVGRAARAETLLRDELLTEAFKALEDAYMRAWRSTTIDDVAGREKLFLAINIVGKVQAHLASAVSHGKLAQAEINQIAEAAERRKRFGWV
ncbi:hypothetical protein [Bradyrhizobium sp.]|uniref:hypothetical protein n=1 Tax=Bradyrhizobium sp. TaxID=376 RepID=UPI003C4DC6BD